MGENLRISDHVWNKTVFIRPVQCLFEFCPACRMKAGLSEMGIEFLVDEAYRLPQLNTVFIPEGVDDASVRRQLLENYDLEIGAGLGGLAGKVWRIGLMGYSSREENVELCLRALRETI